MYTRLTEGHMVKPISAVRVLHVQCFEVVVVVTSRCGAAVASTTPSLVAW